MCLIVLANPGLLLGSEVILGLVGPVYSYTWRPPPLVGFYEGCAHGELVEENTVRDEGWLAHQFVDGDGSHFSGDVIADGSRGTVGC